MEIYARVQEVRRTGRRVTAVVMPANLYRIVQDYRSRLGTVPEGLPDYLGRYDLFGIPIYTDTGDTIIIKSAPETVS